MREWRDRDIPEENICSLFDYGSLNSQKITTLSAWNWNPILKIIDKVCSLSIVKYFLFPKTYRIQSYWYTRTILEDNVGNLISMCIGTELSLLIFANFLRILRKICSSLKFSMFQKIHQLTSLVSFTAKIVYSRKEMRYFFLNL